MAQPTDFSLDPLASSGNTADGYLAIGWRDGKGGAYFYGGKEVMWMSHTYDICTIVQIDTPPKIGIPITNTCNLIVRQET